MRNQILPAIMAFALSACGDAPSAKKEDAAAEAKRTAEELTGGEAGAPSTNPMCKLFSPAELAPYAGAPLTEPVDAAGGSGCQWVAKTGEGDVLIQIVDASYHSTNNLSDTYKSVPDIGTKGYSTKAFNGWQAGAISGEQSVNVIVAGPAVSREKAVELLRETVKRRPVE